MESVSDAKERAISKIDAMRSLSCQVRGGLVGRIRAARTPAGIAAILHKANAAAIALNQIRLGVSPLEEGRLLGFPVEDVEGGPDFDEGSIVFGNL